MYDLLVTNGRVIDPSQNIDGQMDVVKMKPGAKLRI